MWRNGRRVLYTADYIQGYRNALRQAREDLQDMHFKHLCDMANLHRELDKARAEFNELRAVVLARQRADSELATLYREAAIVRARAAERDPSVPLQ